MKKLLFVSYLLLTLISLAFAQNPQKADATLSASLAKFRKAITQKDTATFLSFISRTKGLKIMNTIDQGELGNADKPMLDSKLKYATLVSDFKKRGDNYKNFFMKSDVAPSF